MISIFCGDCSTDPAAATMIENPIQSVEILNMTKADWMYYSE